MTITRRIGQLFTHIPRRRRWQFALLAALMLAGVVAEMITLGAVVPFLALLADPGIARNHAFVRRLLPAGGSIRDMQLTAAIAFSFFALAGAGLRILLAWFINRVSYGLGSDLASEVYRRTLYRPYAWHASRNSGEILAGMQKVTAVTFGVIVQVVQGSVALVLCLAIIATLVFIDPVIALAAAGGFTLLYGSTIWACRGAMRRNSRAIAQNETRRVQAIQEGLGGIRDILLDATQPVHWHRFAQLDYTVQRARASVAFIASSPRFFVEATGMILIVALAYWVSVREGGLMAAVPTLGALAFGAQKLLPQMQLAYGAWSSVSSTHHQLDDVLELLERPVAHEAAPRTRRIVEAGAAATPPLVALKHVRFRYTPDGREVLRDVSLEIPRGARIGIVGATGSGKSTLVDLLMGLLSPTSGQVDIEGVPLDAASCRGWQARVAHVPQAIYLSEASIAENIAFGVPAAGIDMDLVHEAARKAQLDAFISGLPEGYATTVGERGVRLSGGQRQRIGLARALYKRADVLVLDEATSALDGATEKAVMSALAELGPQVTVMMIAHRLSTLADCDAILLLEAQRPPRWVTYAALTAAPSDGIAPGGSIAATAA